MRRFALLCLLASCATAPEPLAEPPLRIDVQSLQPGWLTNLLAPAATGSSAASAGPTSQLRIVAFAVREEPLGQPAQDLATVITATNGTPFPGASSTLRTSRVLTGDPAKEWARAAAERPDFEVQELGRAEALVGPELAARIASNAPPFHFTLANRDGVIHLALQSAAGDLLTFAPELRRTGDTAILWMPARDDGIRLAFCFEHSGAAEPAAVSTAITAAKTTTQATEAATTTMPAANETIERQLALARSAIGEQNRRPALLALARRLQQPELEDVLLCADEAALLTIATQLPAAGELPVGPEASWAFARKVWTAIAMVLQRDSASPALRACLLRHLGAVYYDPTTLELLVQAANGEAAMAAALQDENLTALGDRSTASRVRAKEWLTARGVVVPGYDPLGALASRQRALRAHAAQAATQAAATGAAEAGR